MLRDCEKARHIWNLLINPLFSSIFFNLSLQDWLEWNMTASLGARLTERWPWTNVFGLTCWLIWKDRCCRCFEATDQPPRQIVNWCLHLLMEEVVNGSYRHKIFQVHTREESKWHPPPQGYVRLDVDGSSRTCGQATCAGLV